MINCCYCPKPINMRKDSFVIYTRKKDDKIEYKHSHFSCTDQKLEEHNNTFREWKESFKHYVKWTNVFKK